jgi:amino acid permease
MAKPRQADRVVEVAYGIAMIVNVLVSVSGYLMYGTGVSDEVHLSPEANIWVKLIIRSAGI